jgi:hypothetical protein
VDAGTPPIAAQPPTPEEQTVAALKALGLPEPHPDQPLPRGRVTYVPITSSSFDKQDLIDEHPTEPDRTEHHPVP